MSDSNPLLAALAPSKQIVNNGANHPARDAHHSVDGPPPPFSREAKPDSSLTAAADLIKTLDCAFAEMNTFAITAARDAEEARKNARAASEMARRFTSNRSLPKDISFPPNVHGEQRTHKSSGPIHPPPPPPDIVNGTAPPVFASPLPAKQHKDSSPSRNGKKRTPSSAERLAQAHAEDVLALSLELERNKQTLESEQMSHDETKAALSQSKAKNAHLEAQIQKLLNDMETQRENHGRKVDSMEQELSRSRMRVEAAEEDAQMALDLAKGNAESREQLEGWLQRALHEIQILREHVVKMETAQGSRVDQQLSENGGHAEDDRKRVVRFADEEPPSQPPVQPAAASPPSRPSRSMVASGRKLLQRALASGHDATESPLHTVSSPTSQASAERRRRFRSRLETLGVDNVDLPATPSSLGSSPASSSSSPRPRKDFGTALEALDVCRNTALILKESGKRLNLAGRWWSDRSNVMSEEIHLATLARHYCTAVEVQLDRKQKEVIELESLCSLWEQGNSFGSNAETPDV